MKLQLILTSTPIIVSDEEIKEGDWYNSNLGITKLGKTTRNVEKWRQKIVAGYAELPTIDFNGFEEKLEIVDVVKLGLEATNSEREKHIKKFNSKQFIDYTLKFHCENIKDEEMLSKKIFLNRSQDYRRGFEEGFKAAQESKRFSLEDVLSIIEAEEFGRGSFHRDEFKMRVITKIQSLSQPQVFDIEVEMEELFLEEDSSSYTHEKNDVSGSKQFPKITNNQIKIVKIL